MGAPDVVVAYRASWVEDFRAIADHLEPFLVGVPHHVEHVGSASVAGLDAKPIIDLDGVVPTCGSVAAAIAGLVAAGYEHRGDQGIAGREAFGTVDGLPYHHLYVVVAGRPPYRDHVDLRDHLRSTERIHLRPRYVHASDSARRGAGRPLFSCQPADRSRSPSAGECSR